MNAQLFDKVKVGRDIKEQFGFSGEITSAIAYDIDVSASAKASLFLTKKKQLLCYITAEGRLTLGDVRKIIRHMGLMADLYMPPRGQTRYFDEIGRAKFREVFPGRKPNSESDIDYYRTLATYNPALVLISGVHDGVVYQYDRDASGGWRPSVKFAYRRIKTS